jgi:hypothetical protein
MSVEAYNALEASQLCSESGLFKEQAYLLIKIGNKDEAIRIIIE